MMNFELTSILVIAKFNQSISIIQNS